MPDADGPVLVSYTGGPAFVSALAQMMRDEGLLASYEPPIEGHGANQAGEAVIVVITVTGHPLVWGSLKAAVKKFRVYHPDASIEFEGDEGEERSPPPDR
jgi:hypothetical protein